MDQSASQLAVTAAYGGSDIASPNFNRPRYVHYTSVNTPRDFGQVRSAGLDLEGVIGAESGSQTLFFSFEALSPSRIGLRRILLNRYTDQYISISLGNEAGPIALGIDGFGDSSVLTPGTLLTFDLGYVACDYWITGYCEADCQKSSGLASASGGSTTDDPTSEFSSPLAGVLPAGVYRIVISSTEWPELPYRLQVSVNPAGELSGASDLQDTSAGRLGLAQLAGAAQMKSTPVGTLARRVDLDGVAIAQASPVGTITRTPPYGS